MFDVLESEATIAALSHPLNGQRPPVPPASNRRFTDAESLGSLLRAEPSRRPICHLTIIKVGIPSGLEEEEWKQQRRRAPEAV